MEVNKYKKISFWLQIIFFVCLEYSYITFVNKYYDYAGFQMDFDIIKYIVAKLIFIVIILMLQSNKISDFMYSVINLFVALIFSPNIILYQFMDFNPLIIILLTTFFILIILISRLKFKRIFSFPQIKQKQQIILLLFVTLILLLPVIIAYKLNLHFQVLLFQDIYKIREENTLTGNAFSNYTYSWLAKIILPLLLIYGLERKKPFISAISVFILLYLFLTIAHKSMFFSIIVVFIYYLVKGYYKQTAFILLAFVGAFFVSRFFIVFSDNIIPESLFVRRVFFLPALINQYYFDFFHDNHIHLSHSIFSRFIEYPYDLTPAKKMGLEYFGNREQSANNGFLSDGYMNFGIIGVMFNIFSIIIMFKFFETQKINSKYSGLFFISIFTLISSYFLTSILSHGIFLLIIFSILILRDSKSSENNINKNKS